MNNSENVNSFSSPDEDPFLMQTTRPSELTPPSAPLSPSSAISEWENTKKDAAPVFQPPIEAESEGAKKI